VNAHDVSSALVRPNANAQTAHVELALTPSGVERFTPWPERWASEGRPPSWLTAESSAHPARHNRLPGKGVITGLELTMRKELEARRNAGACISGRSLASSPRVGDRSRVRGLLPGGGDHPLRLLASNGACGLGQALEGDVVV